MAGEEMDRGKLPLTAEVATTQDGKDITRGYVGSLNYLQPQDKVLLYQGGGNYEIYEDLLRDDRVHSALAQRRSAVIARETLVAPGGLKRRDRMAAEFMQEQLDHIGWDHITDMMLYGTHYGFSVAEALYMRDGAHVVLDQVRVRNRRRFVFDTKFKPRLLTTKNSVGEELPERKFWAFAAGADNSDEPYGRGLGHQLYWPVWFKKNQIQFWLVYLDKYATPTAVGKYPRGTLDEERDKILEALRAIRQDSAIALPEDVVVELLKASSTGTVDYAAFYDRMQNVITTIVLSQTMTTEDGSSLSQAAVHMEVREELVESDAFLVSDSWNRQIGAWLTEYNFPGAAPPVVSRIMGSADGKKPLAERDKLIVDMGHRLTAEYITETYGVEVDTSMPAPNPMPPGAGDGGSPEFAEDDPALAALGGTLRDAAGPKIDALAGQARAALDDAGSLTAWRDWLDTAATGDLDTAALTTALAEGLRIAHLTGYADAQDRTVALAEADTARLPFPEQVDFFRSKTDLNTRAWTDIWQSAHDKSFVVAGAARDGLVTDFRRAVNGAIEDGTTLEKFRADFDRIVEKHGWSYKGGRDWRTRVIYDTNIRTSYAAGRYQQMQAVKAERPYWRYRHSHASEQPRAEHVAWDGIVLHADDPWWDTHAPPNGWGCKCYIETLAERDMKRLGKDGPDQAPPLQLETRTVGSGANARTVEVPKGISPGFAYAPGKSVALGSLVEAQLSKNIASPPEMAAASAARTLGNPRAMAALTEKWEQFTDATLPAARQVDKSQTIALAAVTTKTQATLLKLDEPVVLQSAIITESRGRVQHSERDPKINRAQALSPEDLKRLPEMLNRPKATLWDTVGKSLLYVDRSVSDARMSKVAVGVGLAEKLKVSGARRRKIVSNPVRTSTYVDAVTLKDKRFLLLEGVLDDE